MHIAVIRKTRPDHTKLGCQVAAAAEIGGPSLLTKPTALHHDTPPRNNESDPSRRGYVAAVSSWSEVPVVDHSSGQDRERTELLHKQVRPQ